MADMKALTEKYGPAPTSFLPLRLVPLEASAVQTLVAGSPVYYPHIKDPEVESSGGPGQ